MRKRTSKRRWKARAILGQSIPRTAFVEHRLGKWRAFEWLPEVNRDALYLKGVFSTRSFQRLQDRLALAALRGDVVMVEWDEAVTIEAKDFYR